jgi:hypothetical protein
LTGEADSQAFPLILWTTLWATPLGRSEVLDFAGFSALPKKPASTTLSQQIKDLALFKRSGRWQPCPTSQIGKIVESLVVLGTLLEETV